MRGEDAVARSLIAAQEAAGARILGPPELGSPVAPSEMSPPGGCFVTLWLDGEAVAGGGVRRLDGGVDLGEVKRMYVVPEVRGRGLGRRLLEEIEAAARELGYRRLRLDTSGTVRRLYEGAGYAPIPDYNGNGRATFWGEKAL